jgi:hypothetical protein
VRAVPLVLLAALAACPAPPARVAPPVPASVDAAPPPPPAPTDPDSWAAAVHVVWDGTAARTHACFETFVNDARLQLHLRVSLTIAVDGQVAGVQLTGPAPLPPLLEECLSSVIRSAVFPPPIDGAAVRLEVPLDFAFVKE